MGMVACEKTVEQTPVVGLLDRSVREITSRVTGIEISRTNFMIHNSSEWDSFFIQTTGDYEAAIVLSAEQPVFYAITQNMKRKGEVLEKDIVICVTEFYNILCGFFVSSLNRTMKLKSRFGIPELKKGQCLQSAGWGSGAVSLRYKCPYGRIQVHASGLPLML